MFDPKIRREEMAKRLGINVQALEQYFQHKRAETSEGQTITPKLERQSLEWERPLRR